MSEKDAMKDSLKDFGKHCQIGNLYIYLCTLYFLERKWALNIFAVLYLMTIYPFMYTFF